MTGKPEGQPIQPQFRYDTRGNRFIVVADAKEFTERVSDAQEKALREIESRNSGKRNSQNVGLNEALPGKRRSIETHLRGFGSK